MAIVLFWGKIVFMFRVFPNSFTSFFAMMNVMKQRFIIIIKLGVHWPCSNWSNNSWMERTAVYEFLRLPLKNIYQLLFPYPQDSFPWNQHYFVFNFAHFVSPLMHPENLNFYISRFHTFHDMICLFFVRAFDNMNFLLLFIDLNLLGW